MTWGKQWGREAGWFLTPAEAQQCGVGRIRGVLLKSLVAPSLWQTTQPPHSLLSALCPLLVINGGLRLFPRTKVHHGKAQGTGKLGSAKKAEGTS